MGKLLALVMRNPMLLAWIALAAFAAGAVTAGGAAWTIQGWRLAAVQATFDGFVQTTKALGEAAQKAATALEARDKQRKELADAENDRLILRLRTDIKRLRDARPGGGFVPAAGAGSLRPDLACFDRAELERALRALDLGVQSLVDEGSATAVDIDTARAWAR